MTLPSGGLLALDWGQKKIGLATCDSQGVLVTPRGVIFRKNVSKESEWSLVASDVLQLKSEIERYEPGALLLGIPYNADMTEALSTPHALALAQALKIAFHMDVFLQSEVLTSWEAKRRGDLINIHQKGSLDDSGAAALIIEDFLAQYARGESFKKA